MKNFGFPEKRAILLNYCYIIFLLKIVGVHYAQKYVKMG